MTPPSSRSSLRRLPAILVIDDEVRSQEALRRTLEEDFEVLCASSADEGMEILLREQAVRIVLCDQRMPGTTGVQFLKEVGTCWPSCRASAASVRLRSGIGAGRGDGRRSQVQRENIAKFDKRH